MRVAVISDLHIENHRVLPGEYAAGVNRRCRHAADAVRAVPDLLRAAKQRVDAFIVTGDVFDCAQPTPAVIAEAADAFAAFPAPVYLIPGNHERSTDQLGHHALSALRHSKNCIVVSEPEVVLAGTVPGGLLLVPFVTNAAEAIGALVAQHRPAFAFCHVGLVDADSPPWLREGDRLPVDLVRSWCKEHGLRGLFAGDFHAHRAFQEAPSIVQVGALCQADFSDPVDATGFVTVLDTVWRTIWRSQLKRRPAFLACSHHAVVATAASDAAISADALYLSVECPVEKRLAMQAVLDELRDAGDAEAQPLYYRFTDPPDEAAREATERAEAAATAPPAVSAQEVVAAFCAREAGEDAALASRATTLACEALS